MKTKIVSLVAASMLLAGSLNAGEKFISVGYASADTNGVTSTGVSLDLGAKFGETFKHTIGTKFIFLGENDDWTDGQGNLGDIYYSLGYEVLPSTIVAGKVGMGYQSLGSVGTGQNSTAAYAIGLSYGASLTYELSDSFDVGASYTKNDLSFDSVDYSVDVIEAHLAFKF